MALLNRVSQLFRADINAVLDQIEEPEQILKQAIRDMEDELARSENRIEVCSHEQEQMTEQKASLNHMLSELDSELDLCFESDKEELARGIIRRKLQLARQISSLEKQAKANVRYLGREQKLLDENRETLESLRQQAELFVTGSQRDQQPADSFSATGYDKGISEEEVEIAFLKEKSLRSTS